MSRHQDELFGKKQETGEKELPDQGAGTDDYEICRMRSFSGRPGKRKYGMIIFMVSLIR